ncbi:hypothetical protein BRADI_3g03524v3 [Brachypodium distachyon]|uniref:Knottin scorpion toxin-like domain-containing protein n=1 Tax=Brachypodium distachyon TaxID=15368 RepID=A0A2K2CV03_BRADI|nr:hypothetical protein BRADI_3g03524v3 [Brachypodium distachyon]
MNSTRVLELLVALLAMYSTTLLSCHAAGRNSAAVPSDLVDWTKVCTVAKGCAPMPHPQPNHDDFCKAYCLTLGFDPQQSYCNSDFGGSCCCVKRSSGK